MTIPTARARSSAPWCAAKPPEKPTGAVLYVHGFTDYFFQTALADFFTERGFAFFALDLRKCGRSRRPGQTPHYVSDLRLYDDAELSRALAAVRHETDDAPVLLAGHSTGGLVLSLWLDRLNAGDPVVRKARASVDSCSTARSSTSRASRGCGAGVPSCSG